MPVDEAAHLDMTDWAIGGPQRSIRVWGYGTPEVAPGILAQVEGLVGARLRLEPSKE